MERKLKKGSKVWVKDDDHAWVEGIILGRYKPTCAREDASVVNKALRDPLSGVPNPYRIVVQLGKELKRRGGKTRVVDARLECEVRRSKSAKVYAHVEDLTSIDTLHEPGLLEALEQRYAQDRIYTFTGRILLAVNPFKHIEGLYGQDVVKRYASATADEDLPAHIYKVAATVYKDIMERGGLNQTILVSGESGAGKTESTKIIMRSLAAMSQWRSKGALGTDISERVLQSNPVLESFGNSCTIRNENSSRFGKLIEMKFDAESGGTLGAHITTYLLEKARITQQFEGERNFHVFYEMAAGGTDEQLDRWRIPGSLHTFNFITQKDLMEREESSDASNFAATVQAMYDLGMSEEEVDEIFDIAAGILHLGNLSFEAVGYEQTCRIKFDDDTMLSCEACCDLLKVDADALEFALCRRVIRVRGTDQDLAQRGNLPAHLRRADEQFEKSLTVTEAALARDALAMTLYERMFGWLVWRLNQCILPEPIHDKRNKGARARMSKRAMEAEMTVEIDDHIYNTQHKIGLLDVFGFEVFERNGFAQLCINYCNETLQNLFNETVFKRDQLEYDEEGIDWTFIRYPDNGACIEMFESKPIGLFSLMDENCMYPGGNDHTMVTKMWAHLPDRFTRFLAPTKEETADFKFRVRHYAGDVVYSADGFFAQNKNELRQEAVDLVAASRSSILQILLPPEAKDAAGGADIASFFDQKLGSNFAGQRELTSPSSAHNGLSHRNSNSLQSPGTLQQTTVGSHFRVQLKVAVEKIRASSAHYVRCLKPNDENVPDYLDRRRLVEQLRYSGVLQIVQVTRAGYPYRFTFAEFLIRYAVLGKRGTPYKAERLARKANLETQKRNCLKIANNAQLIYGEEYQLGKSKVFLRQLSFIILEVLKDERVAQIANVVQRAARKFLELKRRGHVFSYKPKPKAKQIPKKEKSGKSSSAITDRNYDHAHEDSVISSIQKGGFPMVKTRRAAPFNPHQQDIQTASASNGKGGHSTQHVHVQQESSHKALPSKLAASGKAKVLTPTGSSLQIPSTKKPRPHDFEHMIRDDDEDWEIDLDEESDEKVPGEAVSAASDDADSDQDALVQPHTKKSSMKNSSKETLKSKDVVKSRGSSRTRQSAKHSDLHSVAGDEEEGLVVTSSQSVPHDRSQKNAIRKAQRSPASTRYSDTSSEVHSEVSNDPVIRGSTKRSGLSRRDIEISAVKSSTKKSHRFHDNRHAQEELETNVEDDENFMDESEASVAHGVASEEEEDQNEYLESEEDEDEETDDTQESLSQRIQRHRLATGRVSSPATNKDKQDKAQPGTVRTKLPRQMANGSGKVPPARNSMPSQRSAKEVEHSVEDSEPQRESLPRAPKPQALSSRKKSDTIIKSSAQSKRHQREEPPAVYEDEENEFESEYEIENSHAKISENFDNEEDQVSEEDEEGSLYDDHYDGSRQVIRAREAVFDDEDDSQEDAAEDEEEEDNFPSAQVHRRLASARAARADSVEEALDEDKAVRRVQRVQRTKLTEQVSAPSAKQAQKHHHHQQQRRPKLQEVEETSQSEFSEEEEEEEEEEVSPRQVRQARQTQSPARTGNSSRSPAGPRRSAGSNISSGHAPSHARRAQQASSRKQPQPLQPREYYGEEEESSEEEEEEEEEDYVAPPKGRQQARSSFSHQQVSQQRKASSAGSRSTSSGQPSASKAQQRLPRNYHVEEELEDQEEESSSESEEVQDKYYQDRSPSRRRPSNSSGGSAAAAAAAAAVQHRLSLTISKRSGRSSTNRR